MLGQRDEAEKERSSVRGTRPVLAGGEDGGKHHETRDVCNLSDVGSSCQRETTILVLHSQGTESYQ